MDSTSSNTSSYLKTPGQQPTTTRTRSISQPRPFQQPHQFGYSPSSSSGSPSGHGSGSGSTGGWLGSTSPGSPGSHQANLGLSGGSMRGHGRSLSRSLSNNAIQKVHSSGLGLALGGSGGGDLGHHHVGSGGDFNNFLSGSHGDGLGGEGSNLTLASDSTGKKLGSGVGGPGSGHGGGGRGRSSSLVTVTEVGGDDGDQVVDRLGVGVNENANWVNAPGAWLIHPVIILMGKVLIDSIPNMTASYSWTIINLGYVLASYTMFHSVTGVPFESSQPSGGAYDDLTLWEQIDAGAQYTPAKKWLTSVPIFLFLISTHYVKYDPKLFFINFAACVFVLFPKLPALHRLRFHFTPLENKSLPSNGVTPNPSRPASPHPPGLRMSTLDPIIESRRN